MKFIPLGDKHDDCDFFEDAPRDNDSGKPRKSPSYLETAKKRKSKHKK